MKLEDVRVTKKCYMPTRYYADSNGREATQVTSFMPFCIYLKDNKCTLNACVRRGANDISRV